MFWGVWKMHGPISKTLNNTCWQLCIIQYLPLILTTEPSVTITCIKPMKEVFRMSKAVVMALVNQKGGTGKTQSTENLGIGLANQGKKVLLVDLDPQGSLTISLGYPRTDEIPVTVKDIMAKVLNEERIAEGEGILHHKEGVDLLPANIELSGMELSLVNYMSRERVLKEYIDSVKTNYDYVLIDCMPSLGMLTVNALAAADQLVIPVQAQYLSAKGLEQLLQTVNKVRRQINPKLKIDGILLMVVENIFDCSIFYFFFHLFFKITQLFLLFVCLFCIFRRIV